MTDFFVSWMKPIGRSRIHRGECSNCNNGQGQLGQDKNNSGNTGWDGPFSLEDAKTKLEDRGIQGFTDLGFCGTCLRGHKL